MTVQNIARAAQLKGIDLLSTADCLQEEWLGEIRSALEEAEPGILALRPAMAEAVERTLPARVRRRLRFVLGTEVCCAPPGTPLRGGLHHLLYFPSFDSVERFRLQVARHGDLHDGRPTLALSSRQLLELVLAHDPACRFAPAHVFNPWYASLGAVSGGHSLAEVFDDLAPHLVAVETGLTSTPAMCRRLSSLDHYALFSNSDAHSLVNLGRECTLLDIEPGYEPLFTALRSGDARQVRGTLKVPVEFTQYYLNWCGICQAECEGKTCLRCGRRAVDGARDRLEVVADRAAPVWPPHHPPFRELFPLGDLLAGLLKVGRESGAVTAMQNRLRESLGDDRFILTEATFEQIAAAHTPQLSRAIVAQRTATPRRPPPSGSVPSNEQLSFEI